MKNIFLFLIIALIINACTLKKVQNHHGVHNLKKKNDKIEISITNTNDIISQFGIPSTKSTFDNDLWIYIERKTSSSQLTSLGRKKLLINDILILEFNSMGILVKKDLLSIDDMKDLKINTNKTTVNNTKNSFINTFLSSMRQKINDPLGLKKAK
jgi:outer membrane protein assembly factor BamE (lipoprotein component of BamABCDE complex)